MSVDTSPPRKRGTLAEAGTDALPDPDLRLVPLRSRVGLGWVVCNSSEKTL